MATMTSKNVVDTIIAGNGYYPGDDMRVVKIVEYKNMFDGELAWAVVYETDGDPNRYETSANCIDPKIIWVATT